VKQHFLKVGKGLKEITEIYKCIPVTGSAIIFDHFVYHEGSAVTNGSKYAIRSDLMFTKPL